MKKFAKIIAVMMLVALTVTALVACGYSSDPDKAKEQLENKGFTATVKKYGENDDIVATVYGSKNNIKDFTLAELMDTEQLKKLTFENVTITYFKDAETAKSYAETAKDNLSDTIKKVVKISRSGSQVVVSYKLTGEEAQEAIG